MTEVLILVEEAKDHIFAISNLDCDMNYLFPIEMLCWYPQPKGRGNNNGNEFLGFKFQEMLTSYGIKSKPTMVKSQAGNAIIEQMHETLM